MRAAAIEPVGMARVGVRSGLWRGLAALVIAGAASVAAAAGVGAGQATPDLSGRWILIKTSGGASAGAATVVTVRQEKAKAPPGPSLDRLVVERRTGGKVTSDIYDFGRRGSVSGTGARTLSSVSWFGDQLLIERSRHAGPTRESGPYAEHGEMWSLGPNNTLVIVITDRTHQGEPKTVTLTYRRSGPR